MPKNLYIIYFLDYFCFKKNFKERETNNTYPFLVKSANFMRLYKYLCPVKFIYYSAITYHDLIGE